MSTAITSQASWAQSDCNDACAADGTVLTQVTSSVSSAFAQGLLWADEGAEVMWSDVVQKAVSWCGARWMWLLWRKSCGLMWCKSWVGSCGMWLLWADMAPLG